VTDYRTAPAGVVPRHLQHWLLIGVALVMVGIMALGGGPAKPRPALAPASSATVDPNQQRIEEYQRRIQEQAQRLAAEQAQLELTKDAVTQSGSGSPAPAGAGQSRPGPAATGSTPPVRSRDDGTPRVADNVAFSKDRLASAAPAADTAPAIPYPMLPFMPSQAVPLAAPAATANATATAPVTAPTVAAAGPGQASPALPASRVSSTEPRYRLLEGTVIDTVLTNRLDGTFTGPVNCLVSVPVYASDQQHLVIPPGARVLGEAKAVTTFGQSRLAVTFHRILLPNGTRVDLDAFQGLNQAGDLGLQDQVDRHYAQLFGVSLALGALAGFAQMQTSVGLDATGLDLYRQGVAANVSQSSARILDRFLNVLPTITIREGHRIKVYLSSDLELPAYHEPALARGGRP
jgi:type IV secretion system protein VirB10